MAESPYTITVVDSDNSALLPVRFHLNGVISHFFVPKNISLEELKFRVIKDFDVHKDSHSLELLYKAGQVWVNLASPEQFNESLQHFERNGLPKYEIYLDT